MHHGATENTEFRLVFKQRSILFLLSALSASVVNLGCETAPKDTPPLPPGPALTYDKLQSGHAARVAPITQMWSRSEVEFRWTAEDGDREFEDGDGPLIVRPPHELALAIGKLGRTRFWLGCDADRYWLFDLADDKRVAYVGRQDNVYRAARQVLPIPLRPDQIITLLDLTPLPPPEAVGEHVLVTRSGDEHLIVLPPDRKLAGLTRLVRMDAAYRVTSIELLDRRGRALITADLSRFDPMRIADLPIEQRPDIAERVHITIGTDEDATAITIFVKSATFGENEVKDKQFEFETLVKALKVDEVVDVDRTDQR